MSKIRWENNKEARQQLTVDLKEFCDDLRSRLQHLEDGTMSRADIQAQRSADIKRVTCSPTASTRASGARTTARGSA